MFQEFHVGNLFKPGMTRFQEAVRFNVDDSGAALYIFLHEPTNEEIESIQLGKLDIGMYVEEEVIFMTFKFFRMHRMDSPFSAKLSRDLTKLPEIQDGEGFALTVFLIDAGTGILRAMRLIGLSTVFSRSLKAAMEYQLSLPFNVQTFEAKFKDMMRKYSPDQLFARSQETCTIEHVQY